MAIKIAGTEVINDDKRFLNNESLPTIRPTLNLDFVNSKTVDPRITFTRSTTATYYDGKTTAKAEENLLRYATAVHEWSAIANVNKVGNTEVAPDGTTTAAKIYRTSGTDRCIVYRDDATVGIVQTHSMYLKAGEKTGAIFQAGLSGNVTVARWDLSNGTNTYLDTSNGRSQTITSVGNGWYRVTVTQINNGPYTPFGISDSGSTELFIPNGTDGGYLWGGQLETRDSATALTVTTTTPITRYQPVLKTASANQPRFDHDPVTGESKGLLIEEQRTNVFTGNDDLGGNMLPVGGVIQTNVAVSSSGEATAMQFIPSSTSAFAYKSGGLTGVTTSIFAKSSGKRYLRIVHAGGGFYSHFDLQEGVAVDSAGSATIEDVGNGWYRCSHYDANYHNVTRFYAADNVDSTEVAPDDFSGILLWGLQQEVGSFPTSYIPTSGSQATRGSDAASISDMTWASTGKGSIVCSADPAISASGNARSFFEINGGSTSDRICAYNTNNGVTTYYEFRTGNTALWGPTLAVSNNVVALSYDTSEMQVAHGDIASTIGGSFRQFVPTKLLIGDIYSGGAYKTNGTIRYLKYYPEHLSQAELQALTQE